jgi:cytoplasmic iron level regulating protein YaaA (DUF328/UPF0246 family)
VLILLPPSEGKAAPRRRGRPVDLASLSLPDLSDTRAAVRDALVAASARPDALAVLGVGESLRREVGRNMLLPRLPAAGALEVYTGVLYEALDHRTLSPAARRLAARVLRVQSALWGPVGPGDRIAPYRLSMGTNLPGLGPLARLWRAVLEEPMATLAGDEVVVDCRSAGYAAAWAPSGDAARRLVAVRVFTEVGGRRTVVSHLAKHTRGQVTRLLLEHAGRLRTVEHVAAAVAGSHRCALVDHGRRGFSLDVLR